MNTQKKTLSSFAPVAVQQNLAAVTGGCGCSCPPPPKKQKGNNGLGNGCDPAPPGLVKNGKGDFNDGHLC